jgi:hypothetical protein
MRYILGAYGSLYTPGQDVIRLESRNYDGTDDIYYRLIPPWYRNARQNGIKCGYHFEYKIPVPSIGLPEIAGGGDPWSGPFYPYERDDAAEGYDYGQFIYGAPDGHPDGVIIALKEKHQTDY